MQVDLLQRPAELAASRAEVPGDDTGAQPRLVYADGERVGLFRGWDELCAALEPAGLLRVDPAGCQFFLAYGLVPPPYTLYAHVYTLGVGDRFDPERGAFSVDYPWFERSSREDRGYDPQVLRMLLGEAVARSVPPDEPTLFMQSAGKDSAGLLVGLAQAGRTNVRAVTYDARHGEQEAAPAAELARRLGVPHSVVESDPEAELEAYLRFAARSPSTCADVTLFSYLHALDRCGVAGGVVMDGLGNDGYMGYVVPSRDAWLSRLSLARRIPSLWGRTEPPAVGARAAYLWKTFQMFPAERCLAGSRLAPRTVLRLIPCETPFGRHFAELDRRWSGLSPLDFRSYVRARIFDGAMTMPKARLAAAGRGARAVFPYCDPLLIEYCFHLPAAERYDLRRRLNKLPLRRLLAREIGDGPYLRQKGSFRFDVVRFVAVNEKRIREEILRARPLLAELDRWTGYLCERKSSYVHAYELTTLFMLCAWLTRRPAAVGTDLRSPAGYPDVAV